MRVSIDIDGAAGLAVQYRAAGSAVRRLSGPTREAGDVLKDVADSLAPRRTGALIRSGRVRVMGSTASLGYGIRYAGYVEFGTSKMAAQPYIRPAGPLAESAIVDVYDDHTDRATRPIR